jgi:pimeloyl-ACP methyl ester carboxylesterase
VQSGASRFWAASIAASIALALIATAAQAQIAWTPCKDTNDFACGHLTVPLDPGDGGQGTITLAMRRHLAPTGEAKDAVIALAGGPGQAAIPFAEDFDRLLGPIISTRDLIVFDQRGTGLSRSLSCAAFERLGRHSPSAAAIGICGDQLGAEKGFYRTAETVADIEAIRRAGGYEKLVLYGTSYGTKVAERYAQTYPSHVEALVLDSVVPPEGPDPLDRSTFAAIRRVLRTLCAGRACAHVTGDPVGDLARLVRRIDRRGPLPARTIDDEGKPWKRSVSAEDLLAVLYAGDFNPFLRAEYPAAIRSAELGDPAALGRMLQRAEGEGEAESEDPSEGFDTPLFFDTTCEEESLPWNRASNPAARLHEALAYASGLPAATFLPFTALQALQSGAVQDCSHWSFSSAGPEVDEAPMPAVPTLILSGEADIRTPTANAEQVAHAIPGAQLLVVPNTGHSVLGSALSECPRAALRSFFALGRISACAGHEVPPAPAVFPLAPRRLRSVREAAGGHGLAGRALQAVLLSLEDFERQSDLQFISRLGGRALVTQFGLRIGGLRAGWAKLAEGQLSLHRYTYVPGVPVSGRLGSKAGTLRVGGGRAIRGGLRLDGHRHLVGSLGGVRVRSARPILAP